MSLIVALKHEGKTYVGSEARITIGGNYLDTTTKIFKPVKNQNIILGAVGYLRAIDVLTMKDCWITEFDEWQFSTGKLNFDKKYIVKNIVPALFKLFEEYDYLTVANGIKSIPGSSITFIYKDMITQIASDGAVTVYDLIYATGCATDLALGSLEETIKEAPKKRIRKAIETSLKHDPAVGGKITTLEIEH